MRNFVCILVASVTLFLHGCQGSVVGDAVAGKDGLARQDDEYCVSIGAKPGTDLYAQCRMFRTEDRGRKHDRAWARIRASQAMQPTYQPMRTTTCRQTAAGQATCTTF